MRDRINDIVFDLVVEEMGKLVTRTPRGFGASQPYSLRSKKEPLGEPSLMDVMQDEAMEADEDDSPVKISRAFSKN